MQNVSDHFRGSGFKVFARLLETAKNEVWAIPAPGGGQRTFADRMNPGRRARDSRARYILFFDRSKDETTLQQDPKATGIGGRGPLANNIGPSAPKRSRPARPQAGRRGVLRRRRSRGFRQVRRAARGKVGQELKLVDENRFEFAWIVDFPMYEWNEDEKKIDFSHNPFSMPQGGLEALQDKDPLTSRRSNTTSPAMATNSPRAASAIIAGSDGQGV